MNLLASSQSGVYQTRTFSHIPTQQYLSFVGNVTCNSLSTLNLDHRSSRIRSVRRNGSAAPHNNWSPTVNAVKYEPLLFPFNGSLRSLPTGTLSEPLTFAGVSSVSVASRRFGITLTHSLASSSISSISSKGTSFLSLIVNA